MKDSLRILQVIQSMGKGGAERYAADLSIALKKQGHTVKLVSFDSTNDYSFLTNRFDFEICPSWVQPSITSRPDINVDNFQKILEEFKPNVLHSHLFKAEMTSRRVIRKDCVYVTTCHNNMPEFENFSFKTLLNKRKLTNLYEKQLMLKKYKKCGNQFIAISKDTLAFYKSTLPEIHSANLKLLHNGIDIEKFLRSSRTPLNDSDCLKLISIGRFVSYKNQSFLVYVVKELVKREVDVTLQLLGEGPDFEKVQKLIVKNNLQNRIQLLGNVDTVEDYLHEADLYVHPATYEPFGLVIIEAMAAGLPAICLDGKGNRDLIENGKNGYMIMEENAAAFAEKIIEVVENPNAYRAMSDYAVEYSKQFDINVHARKLTDYYLSFIKEKSVTT